MIKDKENLLVIITKILQKHHYPNKDRLALELHIAVCTYVNEQFARFTLESEFLVIDHCQLMKLFNSICH